MEEMWKMMEKGVKNGYRVGWGGEVREEGLSGKGVGMG